MELPLPHIENHRELAGSSGHHSAFSVGDDVDTGAVLKWLSLLVFFLTFLEIILSQIERSVKDSHRHNEMLGKVYRELMILGMISFVSIMLTEARVLDTSTSGFLPFESAHLIVFFTAVMLVFQAVCIFMTSKRIILIYDWLEGFTSTRVVDMHRNHQKLIASSNWQRLNPRNWLTSIAIEKYLTIKLFRSYFIKAHRLPIHFSFSLYLREALEKQITHLIEIEPKIWILMLAIWWGIHGLEQILKSYLTGSDLAIFDLWYYFGIACTLCALHICFVKALEIYTQSMLAVTGCTSVKNLVTTLDRIAWQEDHMREAESTVESIEALRRRSEQQKRIETGESEGTDERFVEPDSKLKKPTIIPSPKTKSLPKRGPRMNRFSSVTDFRTMQSYRPLLISALQKFLILWNGFFLAWYLVSICNMTVKNFNYSSAAVAGVLLPVPLVLNSVVLQPYMIHQHLLIISIWRVDSHVLGKVLELMVDSVVARDELGVRLRSRLKSNGQSVRDLRELLRSFDINGDGIIDERELKSILRELEIHLSIFRFNALTRCLRELNGKIQVEDLCSMFECGSPTDTADAEQSKNQGCSTSELELTEKQKDCVSEIPQSVSSFVAALDIDKNP